MQVVGEARQRRFRLVLTNAVQQHHKLITAEPGKDIGMAKTHLHGIGKVHQRAVALAVAMPVIDGLKTVEIEKRQAGGQLFQLTLIQRHLTQRHKAAPVGDLRQLIGRRGLKRYQLGFGHGRQIAQRVQILRVELARMIIDDAQRTDFGTRRRAQRIARVETHRIVCIGNQRIIAEARVGQRVLDHHHFILQDGMTAKRDVTRGGWPIKTVAGFKPLIVILQQTDHRDRNVKQTSGKAG